MKGITSLRKVTVEIFFFHKKVFIDLTKLQLT